jgi:hypothetical protein
MRWILASFVTAAGLASAGAQSPNPTCPLPNFMCGGTTQRGQLIVPSWCANTNPFLVPQPPSLLANASTDLASYQPNYACVGNATANPLTECTVIESFSAWEAPASVDIHGNINGTSKVIGVANRDDSSPTPYSSLSLFDQRFNPVSSPVQRFWGNTAFVEVQSLFYSNSKTSLIAYGGPTYNNFTTFPATPCSPLGCIYLSFVEMDLIATGGQATDDAFQSAGGHFEQPASLSDVQAFKATIGSEMQAAIERRRRALRNSEAAAKMRAAYKKHGLLLSPDLEPSVVLGNDAYSSRANDHLSYAPINANLVSMLIYNFDETNEFYGFSILTTMFFPANDTICDTLGDWGPYPCNLPITRWRLMKNGAVIPPTVPMRLKMSIAFYGCTLPDRSLAVAAAYTNFYNETNCLQHRALVFIGTDTTINTFAYQFDANYTVVTDIDLAVNLGTRIFNSEETVGNGAIITEFAPFSEVAMTSPLPSNAPLSGPIPIQPQSVWLSVGTYIPTNANERAAFLKAKRERKHQTLQSGGDFGAKAKKGTSTWKPLGEGGPVPPAAGTGTLLIMRLPQFSDPVGTQFPPLTAPTIINPAGLPSQGFCSQWSYYWNGASCVQQPSFSYSGMDIWAGTLGAQWRYLPGQISSVLISSGCQIYDTNCISTYINQTFYHNGVNSGRSPSSALLDGMTLSSPVAAYHYNSLPIHEKRAVRKLWASLLDRAEAALLQAAPLLLCRRASLAAITSPLALHSLSRTPR